MRKYITKDQAISVLPNSEMIHTFYNPGFGLVGADWSRKEIVEKINNSDIIELTGNTARKMSHGMCAYNNNAKFQSDILFIETDEKKLSAIDLGEEYEISR